MSEKAGSRVAVPAPTSAPAPSFTPARALLMQRKCACGGTPGADGECDQCRKRRLQRSSATSAPLASVPSSVRDVISSPGRPLDNDSRSFFERGFGRDLSGVRVHDGPAAAASARAVDARAYTVGQDIVFGEGRYAPNSDGGRALLAHELAHTVQQHGLHRSSDVIVPSGSEDARLEREADDAATRVLGGSSPSLTPLRTARSVLSRAADDEAAQGEDVEADGKTRRVTARGEVTAGKKSIASFDVDVLDVPAEKGSAALQIFQSLADGGGLRAVLRVSGNRADKASLWQERAATNKLQDRWCALIAWPGGKDRDSLWQLAGGDAVFPKVGGVTCQMDHIVELQVGGNNTDQNIQPLNAAPNRESGAAIKSQVFGLATNILKNKNLVGKKKPNEIQLFFKKVQFDGTPELVSKAGPPTKPTCLAVAAYAPSVPIPKGVTAIVTTEPYPISAGGAPAELKAPIGFSNDAKPAPVPLFADPKNRSAAELIPGFVLRTLRGTKKNHIIDGDIDDDKGRKTRLPITITDKTAPQVEFHVNSSTRVLKLPSKSKEIAFTYPYLSPGAITKIEQDPVHGLQFEGYIKSRIPLLGKVDVAYKQGTFALKKDFKDVLKSPIPQARITHAEGTLQLWPELKPEARFGIAVGPKGKDLATAELRLFRDSYGLAAEGTLDVHIPGLDKAGGNLKYSNEQWTGMAVIRADQLKNRFKFLKSGEVSVSFEGGKLTPMGEVAFDLPYVENLTANLRYQSNRWIFVGKGTIAPPEKIGLTKVGLYVYYDGEHFEGKAEPGPKFHLLGFVGGIDMLKYRNGKFSGTGSMAFQKGKAKGNLKVNLLETGKFTGRGDISYLITENLLVSGSAELDEKQKLHLAGTLKYLKPIDLPHTSFSGEKTLFEAGISIPIPGLSLGPAVGLKARIDGSLSAGFSIGPARIQGIEISAKFDPLDENPNLEVGGTAQFFLPANAHIGGSVGAGVMLDLFVGDVTGGLIVRARADLDGHFKATVTAMYSTKRYVFTADFELLLSLILLFGIDAFLKARAGWGPFSVSTKKAWKLGEKKVDSGLQFGIKAPFRYASDEPFKAPSWNSIQFIKPTIDFSKLLDRVIAATDPTEQKED